MNGKGWTGRFKGKNNNSLEIGRIRTWLRCEINSY